MQWFFPGKELLAIVVLLINTWCKYEENNRYYWNLWPHVHTPLTPTQFPVVYIDCQIDKQDGHVILQIITQLPVHCNPTSPFLSDSPGFAKASILDKHKSENSKLDVLCWKTPIAITAAMANALPHFNFLFILIQKFLSLSILLSVLCFDSAKVVRIF